MSNTCCSSAISTERVHRMDIIVSARVLQSRPRHLGVRQKIYRNSRTYVCEMRTDSQPHPVCGVRLLGYAFFDSKAFPYAHSSLLKLSPLVTCPSFLTVIVRFTLRRIARFPNWEVINSVLLCFKACTRPESRDFRPSTRTSSST